MNATDRIREALRMGRALRQFPLTIALLESWDREQTRKEDYYRLMYGGKHPLLPSVELRQEYRDLVRRGTGTLR